MISSVATFKYSPETFDVEVRKCQPVLFKRFYTGPTVDVERVKERLGRMRIHVKKGNYGDPNYGNGTKSFHADTSYATTMERFIEDVVEGKKELDPNEPIPYAGNIACDKQCVKNLTGMDIKFPMYERMRPVNKFWVSKADTFTPLHRDSADNFVLHLHGSKKWTLWPIRKDIANKLYYNKSPIAASERALVLDVFDPNLAKFPAFGDIKDLKVQITMEAGAYVWGELFFQGAFCC